MATIKCNKYRCAHCAGKPPIIIPSTAKLAELSHESRMRAFLFAATGNHMWLSYESFALPPVEERFIKQEEK